MSCLSAFPYCSWDSWGKNTGLVCHSLLYGAERRERSAARAEPRGAHAAAPMERFKGEDAGSRGGAPPTPSRPSRRQKAGPRVGGVRHRLRLAFLWGSGEPGRLPLPSPDLCQRSFDPPRRGGRGLGVTRLLTCWRAGGAHGDPSSKPRPPRKDARDRGVPE